MKQKLWFKIPSTIDILGVKFKIIKATQTSGGSFSRELCTITIGTEYIDSDPGSVWNSLIHETSEVIHMLISTRYTDAGNNDWKFFMDHKEFENHNTILSATIRKYLI